MLYLTRKIGESIIINDHIELTVVEVRGRTVKLGFVFPPNASILRKELYEKIAEQNMAAAASADLPDDISLANVDFLGLLSPAKPVAPARTSPPASPPKPPGPNTLKLPDPAKEP